MQQPAGKPPTPSDQAEKFVMIGATRRLSRFLGPLVAATLLALGGAAVAQQPEAGQTPPPAVVVERIEVQEVSDPSEFNARVEAIESVDIRARVLSANRGFRGRGDGTSRRPSVRDRAGPVPSGSCLGPRPGLARRSGPRGCGTHPCPPAGAARTPGGEAALDEARAAFDIAAAEVEIAQAALRTAELDLSYTRITAPIRGQIGRALFTQGNHFDRHRRHDLTCRRGGRGVGRSQVVGTKVSPAQVIICLVDLKVARLAHDPRHLDSITDVANYAGCLAEVLSDA
jgi:Domain of unknown function (DUF6378)